MDHTAVWPFFAHGSLWATLNTMGSFDTEELKK